MFSWQKYLKQKLIQQCDLLATAVEENTSSPRRFYAVLVNSFVLLLGTQSTTTIMTGLLPALAAGTTVAELNTYNGCPVILRERYCLFFLIVICSAHAVHS